MIVRIDGKNIIVDEVTDFDLGQTLECGQCFRYEKIMENEYILVAKNTLLRVKQEENRIIFYDTTKEQYETIWKNYFDLDRDYKNIKNWLLSKDDSLKEAIDSKYGVRILNQDFFEMLITFIISQNKQIPHIMQIVTMISIQYGVRLGEIDGKSYYSFPTPEALSKVSEEEFRSLKAGFRAPYLVDACQKIYNGDIREEELHLLDNEGVLRRLMTIKGVGEKIAHCVMLFGLSRRDAFPVDVWIKRIMEHIYYKKVTKKEVIQQFAKEHFGEYGGYAQQYLFYYARDNKIK